MLQKLISYLERIVVLGSRCDELAPSPHRGSFHGDQLTRSRPGLEFAMGRPLAAARATVLVGIKGCVVDGPSLLRAFEPLPSWRIKIVQFKGVRIKYYDSLVTKYGTVFTTISGQYE